MEGPHLEDSNGTRDDAPEPATDIPPAPVVAAPSKRTGKVYTTKEEKRKDFWRGFWLWWGMNILMGLIFGGLTFLTQGLVSSANGVVSTLISLFVLVLGFAPLAINAAVMLILASRRSQMAFGMLVAFGVAFGIVVILGIIATVVCFISLSQYSNP